MGTKWETTNHTVTMILGMALAIGSLEYRDTGLKLANIFYNGYIEMHAISAMDWPKVRCKIM